MKTTVQREIERFFARFPLRSYPKGQILIFAGENPESLYYIEKGKISVYDISTKGEEVIVNIFSKGAFIPMSWALNKTPNTYFYRADEDTSVRLADPEQAIDFIKTHPEVMLDLLSRVYRGFEGIAARLVHLMSDNALARLTHELVIECQRFGRHTYGKRYILDINESELAARTGLTRETISREMHILKTENLVIIDRKHIVITDLPRLQSKLPS